MSSKEVHEYIVVHEYIIEAETAAEDSDRKMLQYLQKNPPCKVCMSA